MGLQIDTATMFLAIVAVSVAAMIVLLWCYWLNRGEKSLLWTALGFALSASSMLILAARQALSEDLAVAAGGGILLAGISMLIIAAQSFNGKPIDLWIVPGGPGAWLLAINIPAINANPDARVAVLSALSALLYLVAAREFSRRDGLITRLPMTLLMIWQSLFCLARVPLVLWDGAVGIHLNSPFWFGLTSLEALIFIQFAAFLMVILTKERVEKMLRSAAHTDQLTGLGNRRAFFLRGEAAISQAERNGNPLAVILFDLDRFKVINDRFGHPTGDAVIKAFATAASARLRTSDFVARLGGEEFAALLPDTDGEHAALVALHVNQAFEAAVADICRPDLACTTSAGVARLTPDLRTLDAMLSAADRALYDAKALGRGQVRLAATLPPERNARAA